MILSLIFLLFFVFIFLILLFGLLSWTLPLNFVFCDSNIYRLRFFNFLEHEAGIFRDQVSLLFFSSVIFFTLFFFKLLSHIFIPYLHFLEKDIVKLLGLPNLNISANIVKKIFFYFPNFFNIIMQLRLCQHCFIYDSYHSTPW